MNEERPEMKIDVTKDGKLALLEQLIELCWSQNPLSRPSAKDVIMKIKTYMEEESLPRKDVPLA